MPELPDVVIYIERLDALLRGKAIEGVRLKSPFLVRSYDPPLSAAVGKRVLGFRRIGKRIVFELEDTWFIVVHLMIAGRFRWLEPHAKLNPKIGLLALDFPNGTLVLTEASSKKRASLHLLRGETGLVEFQRGGIEPLQASLEEFRTALFRENRTLKRALVDPRLFSGIGNAYSDEILHRARLSPVQRSHLLEPPEVARLYAATRAVLTDWIAALRAEVGEGFPEKVTAFRPEMAVHGRYGKPCPVCQTPVQRIAYAANEVNYCPHCQTGGRLLADRSLSRLLRADWPRSLEKLEELKSRHAASVAPPANPLSPRRKS